mmetsp:Transcript_48995/g.122482  ORF Transcript_48995/g.122482 Transcript_48995/m.122482 type:complete len:201 (-) Transcript_48995:614-1216(-)
MRCCGEDAPCAGSRDEGEASGEFSGLQCFRSYGSSGVCWLRFSARGCRCGDCIRLGGVFLGSSEGELPTTLRSVRMILLPAVAAAPPTSSGGSIPPSTIEFTCTLMLQPSTDTSTSHSWGVADEALCCDKQHSWCSSATSPNATTDSVFGGFKEPWTKTGTMVAQMTPIGFVESTARSSISPIQLSFSSFWVAPSSPPSD